MADAPANRWLVLVAMTGSLSMVMIDQTVVTVALPAMSKDLMLSATGQQWVINAYVLTLAAPVAFGGKLGDLLGGVRTFRAGVLIFFLASLACGFTPSGELGEPLIILFRSLQGAGAAPMMPVSAAIVMAAFDDTERGRAMAAYVGISQVFLAAGPLLGGVLTQVVAWRAVFWLNVPLGIAALIMVRIARPENVGRPGTIKPTSLLLLVGEVGLTVLAVQQASRWSWTSPLTMALLTAGVLLSVVFVRRQSVADDPLIDVHLLRRRPFLGNAAINGLVQFGLLAGVLFASLHFQDLLGFSPLRTGLALLAVILPITVGAQLGGRWDDRAGVRAPVLPTQCWPRATPASASTNWSTCGAATCGPPSTIAKPSSMPATTSTVRSCTPGMTGTAAPFGRRYPCCRPPAAPWRSPRTERRPWDTCSSQTTRRPPGRRSTRRRSSCSAAASRGTWPRGARPADSVWPPSSAIRPITTLPPPFGRRPETRCGSGWCPAIPCWRPTSPR